MYTVIGIANGGSALEQYRLSIGSTGGGLGSRTLFEGLEHHWNILGSEKATMTATGLGLGQTVPTAVLHLKAGTATASTAPLKLTSGTLLAAAEAGAVEFLTDKYYGTITTGTARKEFTLNDSALTSGRVPYITTNGRLVDAANFLFDGTTLTTPGVRVPYVAKTGNYTLTTADYIVKATTQGITLTMPTAVSISGRLYIIDNGSPGNITVNTTSSQTIEGVLTQIMPTNTSMTLYSDGVNWRIT